MLNGSHAPNENFPAGILGPRADTDAKAMAGDLDVARQFLHFLDPSAERFTFQTFDDDRKRRSPDLVRVLHAPFDEVARVLVALNKQRAGIYITVSETDGRGRKAENIMRSRAVFADLDDGHPASGFPLEPSLLTESSPGRYQAFWLAEGLSHADFAAVMPTVIERCGADPAAKDIARVLRLPGFDNWKRAQPHTVRLIGAHGRRYSRDEILVGFPPPFAPPRVGQQDPGDDKWRSNRLAQRGLDAAEVARRLGGARRSGTGWSCTCPAHDDQHPSLSVAGRDDGGLLVHCHAGCEQGVVIAALAARGISVHPSRETRPGRGPGAKNQLALGDPLPLMREMPPAAKFPIDALGAILGDAARAFQAATQAPMDICGNAALAVAGLAVQAHADVQLPTGEIKPLSLFLVTVARSGERKTSVDNRALSAVKNRESELRDDYDAAIVSHLNAKAAWEAERKRILAPSKKLDVGARKAALDRLGPEPKGPLTPILICHEPTFEGLTKLLIDGQPSVGVFASEGGVFVGGHGFSEEAKLRTAAGLSMLWDDGCLTRVRASEGANALAGRRVAMHLQMQPDVAARLLSDPLLADQGLLSRILVTAPDSLQGTRFWRDPAPEHEAALRAYVVRVQELFRRSMPLRPGTRNELAPRPLPLAREALEAWICFSDDVEQQLSPGAKLQSISGFAAKLPEHAARIAAVLTIFENPEATEIGIDALIHGIALARHYADTALRLHGASRVNVELQEAQKLLAWLETRREPMVSLPDIVQFGPNATRDTSAAKRLVAVLEEHRHMVKVDGVAIVNGKPRRDVWRIAGK